jgi:hypothetical protein
LSSFFYLCTLKTKWVNLRESEVNETENKITVKEKLVSLLENMPDKYLDISIAEISLIDLVIISGGNPDGAHGKLHTHIVLFGDEKFCEELQRRC